MRTVSPTLVAKAGEASRVVSSRAEVRDSRLIFSSLTMTNDDTVRDSEFYDAAPHGTGILRIAEVNNVLYYQYVANPANPLPAWTATAIQLLPNQKAAVEGNRVFYCGADRNYYYLPFTNGTPGSPVSFPVPEISYVEKIAFAPVTSTRVYVSWVDDLAGQVQLGKLVQVNIGGSNVAWGGRAYAETIDLSSFDAVQIDGDDHIFIPDTEKYRFMRLRYSGGWSDPTYPLPLDVVDDTSYWILGGAAVIDNAIYLSGRLARSSGNPMQIYSRGIENYTLGRDMFIGVNGTVSHTLNGHTCPPSSGKLHLISNVLYYFGIGVGYSAPATIQIGYDNPSKKYDLPMAGFRLDMAANAPATLTISAPFSATHAVLRHGSEVRLYVTIGGEEVLFGTYQIDVVGKTLNTDGQNKTISARSTAGKKLSQWVSDASFDYWSQTKHTCNPGLIDQMIRASGNWNLEGDLHLNSLNTDGFVYSVQRACKNSLVRARFYVPSGDFDPVYGVMINYYYKGGTTNQHNGLLITYGPTEHGGGPGISVKYRQGETYYFLTSWSFALPPRDTWHWLAADFHDGLITVYYLEQAAQLNDWTIVGTTSLDWEQFLPWGREQLGKGGIYVKNITDNTLGYTFASDDTVVPVIDNSVFSTPETLLVDSEQISVSGKSVNEAVVGLTVASGQTFPTSPITNPNWTNGVIQKLDISSANTQDICKDSNSKYQGRSFTIKGNIKLRSVKLKVKKVGSPGQNLYLYLTTDNFDNTTPIAGNVITSVSVAPANVPSSFGWVTFDLPDQDLAAENYFLFLTNVAPGNNPILNASNYYQLSVADSTYDPYGIMRVWGSSWTTRTSAVPFEIDGDSVYGDGYEIYISPVGTAKVRDYYDNCALVVVNGTGKGACYKITDYDYVAPSQWVPNRGYIPPDTWQDHVGDLAHGSWVVPDMRRIFVSENPSGMIAPGSQVYIVPGLIVTQRGANGTNATSHSPNTDGDLVVQAYRDLSVEADRFQYISAEPDMRFVDVVKELAGKAGVTTVADEKIIEDTITTSHFSWDIAGDMANAIERPNFSVDIDYTSGEVGIAFRANDSYTAGKAITISSNAIKLKSLASMIGHIEQYTVACPAGRYRISVFDNIYSVWREDRFICSFVDEDPAAGDKAWFITNGPATFGVSWSELDNRVDNFIFDMGKAGLSLLTTLIGEKHIYFQDDASGNLKLFRNRTTANDGSPFLLSAGAESSAADSDLVTRIRVEGAEVAEVFDAGNLSENGNLFALLNLREVNTLDDAQREALYILTERIARINGGSFYGAADPRVEAGDVIEATIYEGATPVSRELVAETVSFMMAIETGQAIFDMQIGGYDAP